MGFFDRFKKKQAPSGLSLLHLPSHPVTPVHGTPPEPEVVAEEIVTEEVVEEYVVPAEGIEAEPVLEAEEEYAVEAEPAPVEEPPPPVPVISPAQAEMDALRASWAELNTIYLAVKDGFRETQEVEAKLQSKERQFFHEIRETQSVLGEILSILTGKDSEKTMDEVNDILASEIGTGDTVREEGLDKETLLRLTREKCAAAMQEIAQFLTKSKDTLNQISAAKTEKEARLSLLERRVEETTNSHAKAGEVMNIFLQEKKRIERDIESLIASQRNIEAQISLLEEKIGAIRKEKESLEGRTSDIDTEKKQLVRQKEEARQGLIEIENKLESLQVELQQLKEEAETAEGLLKLALKEKENLVEDIALVEKSKEDQRFSQRRLETEIEVSRKRTASILSEIEELKAETHRLDQSRKQEEENVELESDKLSQLEAELVRANEERDRLEEQFRQAEEQLKSARNELEEKQLKLMETDENLRNLQVEHDRIRKEGESLQARRAEIETARDGVRAEIAALDQDSSPAERLATLKSKIAEETAGLDALRKAIEETHLEHELALEELGKAREAKEEAARKVREADQQFREILAESDRLREESENLRTRKADAEKERDGLKAEIAILEKDTSPAERLAEIMAKSEAEKGLHASLKAAIEEAQAGRELALETLNKARAAKEEAARKVQEADQQFKGILAESDRLREENESLRARQAELEKERQGILAEIAVLEADTSPAERLASLNAKIAEENQAKEALLKSIREAEAGREQAMGAIQAAQEAKKEAVRQAAEAEQNLKATQAEVERMQAQLAELRKPVEAPPPEPEPVPEPVAAPTPEPVPPPAPAPEPEGIIYEEDETPAPPAPAPVHRPPADDFRPPQPIHVSAAAIASPDTIYEVEEEAAPQPVAVERPEFQTPEHKKAIRLARVCVSDLILYNKQILNTAANQRNFYQVLESHIKKADDYYKEKVSPKVIQERNYFKEELEKLRLSLKP